MPQLDFCEGTQNRGFSFFFCNFSVSRKCITLGAGCKGVEAIFKFAISVCGRNSILFDDSNHDSGVFSCSEFWRQLDMQMGIILVLDYVQIACL